MINTYADSKIYVLCPANIVTGGTELVHQLVDLLVRNKKLAYVVYFDDDNNFVDVQIPENFKKYSIQKESLPTDDKKNILICPESVTGFVFRFNYIQVLFWWMSVDNFYYMDSTLFNQLRFFGPYFTLKYVIYARLIRHQKILTHSKLSKLKKIKNNHIHLYQSFYAKDFLLSKKITNILPLSDYINTDFINNSLSQINVKENIILYNPKKGYDTTKKIIEKLSAYTFVPLVGLNRNDLSNYLSRAKLYIDFGNHPGKDRLPREAAINNCCVITSKEGSAKYYEDVAIPDEYKLNKKDINLIVLRIKNVMQNYEMCITDFELYRNKIMNEKQVFEQEVEALFNLK